MRNNMREETPEFFIRSQRRRIWRKIVSVLACIVVFCTTYALILPGITLGKTPHCGETEHVHTQDCYAKVETGNQTVPACASDDTALPDGSNPSSSQAEPHTHSESCYAVDGTGPVHTHTDACYTLERGELICTESTEVPHTHTETCYTDTSVLVCAIPEENGHTHNDNCFDANGEPICGQEESDGHRHGPACYETTSELTCLLSEEPHQHTEECYAQSKVLTCELPTEPVEPEWICGESEESDVLTCTIPEGYGGHAHGESCFDENGTKICPLTESEGHQHSAICYGTWERICNLEEHTHSLACFSDPTADVETEEDWRKTFADVELTGKWPLDVLAIAESQLGYKESADNYDVEPDGETLNGYTRYGDWYGIPYGDWCAMFLSFCLYYAGVPAAAFPWEASCPRWVEGLEELELYTPAGGEYRPGVGDIVFVDHDGDRQADHVGLVRELRGETTVAGFTTIEGNCGNSVAVQEYAVDDPLILGYGILSVLSEVSPLANHISYGYSGDSIWWEEVAISQTTAVADIQENVPYVIAGNSRLNVLTNIPQGDSMLATARPSDNEYVNYQIWCLEASGSGYRIYTSDEQGNRSYLRLNNDALSLVEDVESATAFVVSQATAGGFPNCFLFQSGSYYLNTYRGDATYCEGWAGYNQADAGSCMQLLQVRLNERQTAQRLETAVSPNAVINLFDYWTGTSQTARDDIDYWNGGINENHNFKFFKNNNLYHEGDNSSCGSMNILQPEAVLNTGIVQSNLIGGYPALSGDADITGGSTESLNYLFDPTVNCTGKAAYSNVGGLLRVNAEGYYYFSSRETMAEYLDDEKYIAVYNRPGVFPNGAGHASDLGQFFPMNSAPQCMMLGATDPVMNHYLGLTITTRFIQRYGGHSDAAGKKPTQFSFAGDDDVWIFIDNVLVADLGGAHASVGVDIDFSTGDIVITYSDEGGNPLTKTVSLFAQYQAAGAEGKTQWVKVERVGEDGVPYDTYTFADNTTHTLKFYYLERGNYDSNLYLKYNLTEIPRTSIYKVDQYGGKVKGATFAVYAADQNYQMLREKSGPVADLSGEAAYDSSGNIIDANGDVLAYALYTGITNADGEMLFMDQDKMPYTLSELEDMFGQNFILREIKAPKGYRVVSKDIHLEIWHGENQTILKCNNTHFSGARAATTLQVTATDTLYLQEPYNESETVQYCDEAGNATGTLFAVVFKYIGPIDASGNATEVNLDKNWVPVYGSDASGYTLVDMKDKTFLAGALEAAKNGQAYGDVTFNLSSNSTMQLTLENLPGHITTYYRMLGSEQKGQTRYTVAYYWTPGSLEEATDGNIHRVYTFAEATTDGTSFSPFDRIFGANIQVPDLINVVLVQKVDENDKLIDGATFALYPVQQQSDNRIFYRTGDGSYVPLSANATWDEDGTITDGDTRIVPLKTSVTRSWSDGIHVGTADFTNLEEGQYLIREVKAPPGYRLNTTDIMVLVTEDTIYANAGTEDDGVSVGRGPGYVVDTLEYLASVGQIDSTLTWIYAQVRVFPSSGRFADVGDLNGIPYLARDHSGETSENEADAVRNYLKYEIKKGVTAFNYVENTERKTFTTDLQNPVFERRLFTTAGWPYYEIYQDYEYGKVTKDSSAHYEDWSSTPLTNLFSRSTYIRVRDMQETELQVKKVSVANHAITLSGAQFRLYRQEEGKEPEYYCRNGDAVRWETNPADALVVTTGADGLSTQGFTKLSDGVYYLEETKAPAGYCLPSEPVKLEIRCAIMTLPDSTPASGHEIKGTLRENINSYLYTVTVPNNTGYRLPETGGSGALPYTVGGLLAVCLSFLLLLVKRKRDQQDVTLS